MPRPSAHGLPCRKVNAGSCAHCHKGTGCKTRRMLCWRCWCDPLVRALYPAKGGGWRARRGP